MAYAQGKENKNAPPAAKPIGKSARALFPLLLTLLFFISISFAQFSNLGGSPTVPGQAYNGQALDSIFGAQGNLATTILRLGLIMLFIATLVYMFGLALSMSNLKGWAKSEFMQVIVTFLLMAAFLSAYSQMWNLMVTSVSGFYNVSHPGQNTANCPNNNCLYEPFTFDQQLINQSLIKCEKTVYNTMYVVNFYYRLVGRLNTSVLGGDPAGGWSVSIYTSFFEYVAGHINYLLLMNYVQFRFLAFIKYAMPLLIALGLVLRVLPFTRGAGGLLIAIGLGFYAVYPVSLAMLMTFLPSPSTSFCTGFSPPPLLNMGDGGVVTTTGDFHQVMLNIQGSSKQVGSLRSQIETFLPVFYLQGMFLPLVAFTVTLTFVRQTGALFGADLSEIGRGLIKLL